MEEKTDDQVIELKKNVKPREFLLKHFMIIEKANLLSKRVRLVLGSKQTDPLCIHYEVSQHGFAQFFIATQVE